MIVCLVCLLHPNALRRVEFAGVRETLVETSLPTLTEVPREECRSKPSMKRRTTAHSNQNCPWITDLHPGFEEHVEQGVVVSAESSTAR